jgi:hypothetical protein
MSDTFKEGKRYRTPRIRPESPEMAQAVTKRHSFGSTEKIRRRNADTWRRLHSKRRRQIDLSVIQDI